MPELRTGEVEKDFIDIFDRSLKILRKKSRAAVIIDLCDGLIKATRKAHQWPGCFEVPIYKDIIGQAVKLVLEGQDNPYKDRRLN